MTFLAETGLNSDNGGASGHNDSEEGVDVISSISKPETFNFLPILG